MFTGSIYFGFLPGLGPGELLVIFFLVLLIFGPKKLPEIGKAFGEFIKQFKKASSDISDEANSDQRHSN